MNYVDTHVHFDALRDTDAETALRRATTAGVTRMLAVGGSMEANAYAVSLSAIHAGTVWPAVGYDRDCAAALPCLKALENCARQKGVVAIGEIGIDLRYSPDTETEQVVLVESQLDLARRLHLPVIMHGRNAEALIGDILKHHARLADPTMLDRIGVVHCFTGSADFARLLLDCGFYLGFTGIVSFQAAGELRAVARSIPDNRILIETDSPYLAPVPFRGKPNEPCLLPYVAEALAEARSVSQDHIAEVTTRNAEMLFCPADAGRPN